VGILRFTGTPVDQGVHVGLNAIESIHVQPKGILSKKPLSQNTLKNSKQAEDNHDEHIADPDTESTVATLSSQVSHDLYEHDNMLPTQVSALMLGLKSRIAVLQVQRQVNQDKLEPLSAIIPGVALGELWRLVGAIENVLRIISAAVMIASLLGLSTMLLASLRERKAEINVLRIMGAKPSFVFWLVQLEALSIALGACIIAVVSVVGLIFLSNDWLLAEYGLSLSPNILSIHILWVLVAVLVATFLIALIPSIGAYRNARTLT
jgi:putative ABC transport system permease protein